MDIFRYIVRAKTGFDVDRYFQRWTVSFLKIVAADSAKVSGKPRILKAALACAASLFIVVFTPAFQLTFGIHNDYERWLYHACCLSYPETQHLFWVGRPVGALLLNLHFAFFHSLQSLAVGRAFSLLVLILALVKAVAIMERHIGLFHPISVGLSTLIFLLPGSLLYVLWLANFVPGVFNILLVCFAYDLVSRSYDSHPSVRSRTGFVFGYSLLLVSFYIYPPTTCFFLVFTMAKILLGPGNSWQKNRRQVLVEIGTFLLLSGVYYLSVKAATPSLVHAVFGPEASPPPHETYQFVLAGSLRDRLHVLLPYVSRSGALWLMDLVPGPTYLYWLGPLLLVSVAAAGQRLWSNHRARLDILQRAFLALVTLVLSAAPVLAAASGFAAIRTIFATSAMIVVWIVAATAWVGSAVRRPAGTNWCLVVLCALGTAAAASRIASASYNASAELEFVRKQVAAFDNSVNSVIVLQPPRGDVIVRSPLSIEFGYMATNYSPIKDNVRPPMQDRFLGLGHSVFDLPIKGIVQAAMQERDLAADTVRNVVIEAFDWESRTHSVRHLAGTRIIDMSQAGFRTVPTTAMLGSVTVKASPLSGCCGPQLAFDGNPNTFFESDAGFPLDLTVSYSHQCQTAAGYRLAPNGLADRMPTDWQLFGRNHVTASWQLLDSRAGISRWSPYRNQTFPIAAPGCFSEYRFRFLKSGDPRLLRIAKIVLSESAEDSQESSEAIQIHASSSMEPFGPEGLLEARDPGWHVKSPKYPEWLELQFASTRHVATVGFLPQRSQLLRAPKAVVVERSENGKTWEPIATWTNSCDAPDEEWRVHTLGKAIETRHLRFEILSNCGTADLLTLRGLKLE